MIAGRMSDAAHVAPNRPTLVVGTIGHHHCGKTSLTCAITELLSRRTQGAVKAVTVPELDRRGGLWRAWNGDHSREKGWLETRTIAAGEVRYATEHRDFVHVDSPGWRPWLKNAARAQALVDALILVVSGPKGVEPQTHEHLLLARAFGLSQIVVFLNKCDLVADAEWLDLVEQDVRELLIRCGFDGDGTRIIRGAAAPQADDRQRWEGCISDLLEVLELELQVPEHTVQGPPLLYFDHVYPRWSNHEGLVIDGRVRRGQVRPGDTLVVAGFGEPLEVQVSKLEMNHRKVERAQAGEFVGVRLVRPGQALNVGLLHSGQALVNPGTRAVRSLTVHLELLATEEHGRRTPIRSGHVGLLLFGTTVVAGRFDVVAQETIAPGEGATVTVELVHPVYVERGMPFLLRDGTQGPLLPAGERARWAGTAGMGRVLDVRS